MYVWGEFHRHRVQLDDQAEMIAERLLMAGVRSATVYTPHDMRSPRGAALGHVVSSEASYRRILAPYGYFVRMAPSGPDFRAQRKTRWHQFLSEAPDGKPWLQIMDGRAPSLVKTLPTLRVDPNDTDDIRERGEDDHDYDSLGAVLLSARNFYIGPSGLPERPQLDVVFR